LSLEIIVPLVLATSTQSEYCCELGILVLFVAVIVVIAIIAIRYVAGTTKNLHELMHKRVDLE